MNWLDIIILIVLAASAIAGLGRGIIRGVVSLVGFILAIFLAGRMHETVAGWLRFISNENIAKIVAFVLIILVVIIAADLLGKLLRRLISLAMLGWLDRLLGGVLGLFIGAVFWGALLAVWGKFVGAGSIGGSWLAKLLLDKFPLVLGLLPDSFNSIKDFFK
ncbi:MAG: CvpA family protein [Dehalococcoidia bacterium]|nr:CvpA family protein [Dehalococcoidia bacterium]